MAWAEDPKQRCLSHVGQSSIEFSPEVPVATATGEPLGFWVACLVNMQKHANMQNVNFGQIVENKTGVYAHTALHW